MGDRAEAHCAALLARWPGEQAEDDRADSGDHDGQEPCQHSRARVSGTQFAHFVNKCQHQSAPIPFFGLILITHEQSLQNQSIPTEYRGPAGRDEFGDRPGVVVLDLAVCHPADSAKTVGVLAEHSAVAIDLGYANAA